MPFQIGMDDTFTTTDDDHVQVAGTAKTDLRKRQFTAHIYVNAGEKHKRDGYVELICKSKSLAMKNMKAAEKAAWSKEVNLYGKGVLGWIEK